MALGQDARWLIWQFNDSSASDGAPRTTRNA